MKYSENRAYAIDPETPYLLYVSPGKSAPHDMVHAVMKVPDGHYVPYMYTPKKYKNDCLAFAESMGANKPGYSKKSVFSNPNARVNLNATIAEKDKDTSANPQVGEAYAIVATIPNPKRPHWVRSGARWRDVHYARSICGIRTDTPILCNVYDAKHTFHNTWKSYYKPKPATIVLTKRI
jgi:hypothetical protein